MSRIKDLLAEEENIDDLKPIRQPTAEWVENEAVKMAIVPYSEDYIADNAEFNVVDDDGQPAMVIENFLTMCENLASEFMDKLIEQEHIELSDDEYIKTLDKVSARIADFYSDYESVLCADELSDYNRDSKFIMQQERERHGQC